MSLSPHTGLVPGGTLVPGSGTLVPDRAIKVLVDWTRGGFTGNYTGAAHLTVNTAIAAATTGNFTGTANLTVTATTDASLAVNLPVRVDHIQTASFATGGASKSLSRTFDVVNGDLIVIIGYTTWTGMTLATPTWTGTGTVTLRESVVNVSSARPNIYLWTIPVTATATGRDITIGYTGSQNWGFTATVWRNHQGLGDTAAANGDGAPLVSLNTAASAAVEVGSADTLAVDGTSRAWRVINSQAMTEQLYFRDATQYAVYGGYRIGAAEAPATVGAGLTAPTGQGWAGVAVEIAGSSSGTESPTDVSGLLRRWRADSIAQANGSAVSSWAALTGGVALAQATGTNQPTYQTSSINSQPAVRFITDDWLAATITAQAQPVSYVAVLKANSVTAYQTIVHNGVELQLNVTGTTTWEMWGGSANLNGGTPNTSPVVLTGVADTTDTLYVNGTAVLSGNAGTSGATTTFTVGRHPTAGRPLNGDIAEILLYDHALTTDERATIHTYVQDRYAVPVADYRGRGGGGGGGADNGFGMMVFSNKDLPTQFDQDLAALVETGSTWIRFGIPEGHAGSIASGSFTWTPNVANMNYFTSCVQKAKSAGIKVVVDMADTIRMPWATEQQYRDTQSQYWGHVSQRLGEYVDLWQVFNEMDGQDYRTFAGITMDAAYLDRMRLALLAARTALRQYSAAPLTTTPFGYPINQARYDRWAAFFDGIGSSLDVIGIHAYPETNLATINLLATYLNNIETRYGKPVAVLEFGVPKVSGYGTPTQVGAAIVNQINAIMGTTPMVATLYQLRDRGTNPNDTNGEMVFGILENNFTKKTYWQAVVDCIAAL